MSGTVIAPLPSSRARPRAIRAPAHGEIKPTHPRAWYKVYCNEGRSHLIPPRSLSSELPPRAPRPPPAAVHRAHLLLRYGAMEGRVLRQCAVIGRYGREVHQGARAGQYRLRRGRG
eukprot:2989003-Rhodomonas_salina.1